MGMTLSAKGMKKLEKQSKYIWGKDNKKISKKDREHIIKDLTGTYGYRCWYCGYRFSNNSEVNIEHIVPRSQHGTNSHNNLALSCGFCNSIKMDRDIGTFLKHLARIRSGRFTCLILSKYGHLLEPTERDCLRSEWFE